MRCLTLLLSLPTTPTRHRVGTWRKLRRLGAVNLRGAAWILPETPETIERFQWLVQEVRSFGGEATLLRVDSIDTMTDEQVAALFHKAREAEYRALIEESLDLAGQLQRPRAVPRSLERSRARLQALERELDRVQAIDYLESPLARKARAAFEQAARRLRTAGARPRATPGRRADLPPAGSTWVTRPRPHIDRIASAWLIKRFIDHDARFAFAEAADAAKKGIAFDILGADFGHQGDDCTFETLLGRARLSDRRLNAIAEIVHEADLADGKFPRVEAAGIDLALKGLAATIHDDHDLLERGMAVFDGLYATLKPR